MLSSLGRNVRALLWALVLALSVWVAAVTAADPDQLRTFPKLVSVEIVGQDPALVINGDVPREVQITMRAPQSVWNALEARPDSVRAFIDLSGVGAGEHRMDMQVQIDARPVRIVIVSPSSVIMKLEPLVSRTLPLESTLSGEAAIGYQIGDLTLDPKQVVVSGPESLVSAVTHVTVVVNIGNIRESIDQSLPVEALDQQNTAVSKVSIQPESAHASLPVVRQGGFRDMAVKVIVRGDVAPGYRLDSISVYPPVVTVYSGNPDVVNALPGVIETQPLDLQAAKDNLNLRVDLNLPPGISIVGQSTVLIQAGVSAIQSSLTLSGEKVEVTGLASEMTAQISPETVDVILSGPLPILHTLSPQDIHVKVDVTGLAAGSYQLTPTVQILASSVTVESLLPGTVEVVLAASASPTAHP